MVKLGYYIGAGLPERGPEIELAREAERLGYDSAWVGESWGADAVTQLAWLGALTSRIKLGSAVMQVPARTPANCAMTAATLDQLSGGRFLLGLGTSGPAVVEGWHGRAWREPLTMLREYVEIVRAVLRREPLEFQGRHYVIPHESGDGDEARRPLKLRLRPVRTEIPIFLAAIAPRAVELAAEIAEGWIPIFFVPEAARKVFPSMERARFEVAPIVRVVLTDDVQAGRDALKPYYAFYIGGMGPRGKNFYNDLACHYGFEGEARVIQDRFLDGERAAAAAAVPDDFVDAVALVGPKERIAERVHAFGEAGATTLIASTTDAAALRALADVAL